MPGPRDQENASIPAVCALRRSCLCPGTRGNPRTSCPWEGGDTLYLWLCFVVPPLGCSLGFCMHLQVEESPKLRQAHYPACRAGPPPRALRTPRPAQGPRQTERVPASASIHARPYLTSRPSVTWPWSAGLVLHPPNNPAAFWGRFLHQHGLALIEAVSPWSRPESRSLGLPSADGPQGPPETLCFTAGMCLLTWILVASVTSVLWGNAS